MESLGAGVRVLVGGCWGFAATDDLSDRGLAEAAALARKIAGASSAAKRKDVRLAPEDPCEAVWFRPAASTRSPFRSSKTSPCCSPSTPSYGAIPA